MGVWITLGVGNTEITPERLKQKVESSSPRWANYNEDLKSQIGSTPVARWKGEPVRAFIKDGGATIVFKIEGYWAETPVNLPLLARDPLGFVWREANSQRIGDEVTYTFPLQSKLSTSGLWLEIQYPHHTKRIVFDAQGTWTQ